ncbi:hypothetical protein WSS_A17191 [Rhodococcus opacus M213]|uniref:Uncharacterized protein n=1 Tax=Rhodococcus opacus M213 TaxID=1129896 RepID=K8XTH2_RHOOP|nr:hypothetical protein WSS_A17191 [Rhodococcus opacus M213]GLK36913.1 hypothetical protein GCM10017611_37720 [Rhodococcus wratislaviensis]
MSALDQRQCRGRPDQGFEAGEADRFTADVLLAVTPWRREVPPRAAWAILGAEVVALNALLAAVGPDRDLGSMNNRSRWPRCPA